MATRQITVRLGQLAAPLIVKRVRQGTTLEKFLESNDLNYSTAVLINGQRATAKKVLRNGDMITTSDVNVEGGR